MEIRQIRNAVANAARLPRQVLRDHRRFLKGIAQRSALIAALTLGGCVSPPTQKQALSADYGDAPTGYIEAVHQYFDSTLKDPSSVQYREITAPEHGYALGLLGAGRTYGWLVNATVNAKNSYGGYVGFRTYSFLFRGEEIVDTAAFPVN